VTFLYSSYFVKIDNHVLIAEEWCLMALPSDVRKAMPFPCGFKNTVRLRLEELGGAASKSEQVSNGKAKPRRTSGGQAAIVDSVSPMLGRPAGSDSCPNEMFFMRTTFAGRFYFADSEQNCTSNRSGQ
jgi:hypothetical protein